MSHVVVAREEQDDRWRERLVGFDVVQVSVTETTYVDIDEVVRDVRDLEDVRWYVATSARAARYVARCHELLGRNARVASVGAATTRALESFGVDVDAEGGAGAADLATRIDEGPVVHFAAATPRPELAAGLNSRGIELHTVTCYDTHPHTLGTDEILSIASADALVVGAPSTWGVLKTYVAARTWVLARGATTATVVAADHARTLTGWDDAALRQLRGLLKRRGEESTFAK